MPNRYFAPGKIKLRYYRVESSLGTLGTDTLMSLIVRYADSRGWKPGEVQRLADMEVGETIPIEDLAITRTS